ncbi:MAG: ABC transporter substrate-binding protein [Solirubrobacteraceae bacterium]|nr:ABC transporter substrate-binding protein [Solirubrobacteraceae bacterium]
MCVAVLGGGGFLAACGGDDDEGGTGAGGESTGATEGAKTIDVGAMDNAKGNVTICMGKDTGGDVTAAIKAFNAQKNGVTAKILEFSTSADEQRQQFVQRQEAKSGECDVFSADVIWTAEFASQKWLYDLTPYVDTRRDELIEATLETATFDGKVWGMPQQTDAGFLYFRTDQVQDKPTTWQQVYEDAKAKDGIVYQGAPYEGLTVNFLEMAYAAGGKVLSDDGKKSEINSAENVEALKLMADAVKDGTAARGVTTYMEEESRRYFESGRATYMRNWPYAYALGSKAAAVKGKFDVMPYPEFEGGTKAGILGGHNQVVSVFSKNPGGALKWISYITGEENQKNQFMNASQSPTLKAIYDDPEVQKKYAFATDLRDAISQAKSRPVSPLYPQVSQAIYENVHDALTGKVTPEKALETAQSEMDKALATF